MRFGGVLGSENVGMSNHNIDEMSIRRKPKVSLAMDISQGLGGPKLHPITSDGSDGQTVNIRSPHYFLTKGRSLVV